MCKVGCAVERVDQPNVLIGAGMVHFPRFLGQDRMGGKRPFDDRENRSLGGQINRCHQIDVPFVSHPEVGPIALKPLPDQFTGLFGCRNSRALAIVEQAFV